MKPLILIFCTLALLPYSLLMAYDEPNYEVVQKNEVYEIRANEPTSACDEIVFHFDLNV